MNVLHINTERTWRGGERQTLWLARELRRRGHGNWIAGRMGFPLAARSRGEGLPVISSSPMFGFDPFASWSLRKVVLDNGIDVVHAHTGHAVGLGALAALGTPARLLITRRVDFPLGRNPLTRWKYGRAAAVAAISSRVAEVCRAGGVPPEKIEVIPSGIDPAGYPSVADRDRLRRERGYAPDDKIVVHVGALVPHKDQETLVRAAAKARAVLPTVKFLIVGDGPLRAGLARLAEGLGLRESVLFLHERRDALELTAMADAFVFSSKEEGLGTALLDALAMGVPTAATAAGGIPDIYGGPGRPELSPPGDPDALAANVLKVLTDPAEARRRVERGRERAAHFTVQAMAERYERLYEKITRR